MKKYKGKVPPKKNLKVEIIGPGRDDLDRVAEILKSIGWNSLMNHSQELLYEPEAPNKYSYIFSLDKKDFTKFKRDVASTTLSFGFTLPPEEEVTLFGKALLLQD